MMQIRTAAVLGVAALLSACGHSHAPSGSAADPQSLVLKAQTALPPGQSGFFSSAGEAQGKLTGNPADYGAHVDDQRTMYWSFDGKPATLGGKPGTPTSPKAGIDIYRDDFGVPIVYAGTVHDLWFGVAYAVAQDRLFLMDAVRRTGAGTLAALTGCDSVAADIQQRVVTYSDAEYQQMFDALSPDAKAMVQGYVDGANAWVSVVNTDPNLLPAEYALLTTAPEPFTVRDVLAAGVYITRFVAAEGGNEFQNIRMLRQLADVYGGDVEARKAFQDLVWLEDAKAVTTVPPAEGHFSNQAEPADGREAVFNRMADWALTLPETLARGDGTGHAALPADCAGLAARAPGHQPSPKLLARRQQTRELLAQLTDGLGAMRRKLTGASFAFAIGTSRTRDGGTLLISEPQLGYSYPLLLVEYEIHGAGYDARGVSVPVLPTVGIGYTPYTAWGLTTGYSKTIDSFVETLCSTAQQAAGTCAHNQYFHAGAWKNLDCHSETVRYRLSSQSLPVGAASQSSAVEVCRSVHGPVVARDEGAGLARSLQFAMFRHEFDTIEGIRQWNRAQTFAEFVEGVKKVTWNENVTVASRDGHIGYFHPGLFPRRSADTDMRLPIPGTGAFDFGANLAFDELPHAIDPAQGYLANWNTKPAQGWLDGEGLGSTSRPGGPGQRVTNILDQLGARNDWTFADLRGIDINTGTTDPRAREYLPVIAALRASASARMSDVQKAALDLLLGWDRKHYGPGIELSDPAPTDGPAATIFGYYVEALRDELFAPLKGQVLDTAAISKCTTSPTSQGDITIYKREAGVGSHLFDQSVMDNLVIRVLAPGSSSLALRRDYGGGRDRDTLMLAALDTALARLAAAFNGGAPMLTAADLDKSRRPHPLSALCSLTHVIGPGSATPSGSPVYMPYQDRGSWMHRVGFEKP